ncbi:oxidoreductase, short chain dehydrogenase/reductase family [Luminiphilus syltensis NOR5-1B]|uniref:Oxidoreductase, short chain dehydrogenase/reductase family n=1 Tax=Luminiphilus syltensis NOR5-1B TaxID=565045 RepID=B8KXX7_9GAMM|nr:oxidoreductase, short chain dehydrogenase/reductase family [Luminiphilus syltensis NOR5-1B]
MITGASAGLGLEFARQLAAKGYHLVLVARREDRLETIGTALAAEFGVGVECLVADLSEAGSVEKIVRELAQRGLSIDFLVNNAGIAGPNLITDRDWPAQRDFFQLMMTSVAELCHHLIPPMIERGFGRVVNVASVAGRIALNGSGNYGPAKAYVIALSEELNLLVADTGVNVCALCPGYTHTDFHETAGLGEMKAEMPKWLWYDADGVVRDGLRAVEAGKPVMVSGRLYRWLDPFLQSVWTRWMFRFRTRPD